MKKEKKKKEERLFVTVTACLLGILVIIAVLVTNLEFVFNLIGAIACNSIAIILPCLFYTKLVEMIKNK